MGITRRKLLTGSAIVVVAAGVGVLTPMLMQEGRLVSGKPRVGFVNGMEGRIPEQADVVVIGAG
ncbi:twin-arginine translocation signal domain-containing protein, partial [Salmonella enterica subsp. enterica serovar Oranienburg]|nr:twin-arginine translocation signal domain-containing protein [Salmonella enterica subsp. enterica serovar Oranienburg]